MQCRLDSRLAIACFEHVPVVAREKFGHRTPTVGVIIDDQDTSHEQRDFGS